MPRRTSWHAFHFHQSNLIFDLLYNSSYFNLWPPSWIWGAFQGGPQAYFEEFLSLLDSALTTMGANSPCRHWHPVHRTLQSCICSWCRWPPLSSLSLQGPLSSSLWAIYQPEDDDDRGREESNELIREQYYINGWIKIINSIQSICYTI